MMVNRKQNSHVVYIDPKKKKAPKKAQTKAELVQEITSLKALNDALEDELKKNLETISKLEEKISMHKKSVDIVNAGCQTDDGDLLLCEECEYPAETLYELGEHVGEYHTGLRIPCSSCPDIYTSKKELEKHESEEHNQYNEEALKDHHDIETFNCRFCEKNFRTKRELMKHNKKMHEENVSTCWNFETGTCYYNDCWFSHEQQKLKDKGEFKCNFCESEFKTVSELLKHSKAEHLEKVPMCKNSVKGICLFGNRCLFVHNEKQAEENNHD